MFCSLRRTLGSKHVQAILERPRHQQLVLAIAGLAHEPRESVEPGTWDWGKDSELSGLAKIMAVYRYVLRELSKS